MKRGLISRDEKFNEIKKVTEKAYVSADIGGDEYTNYPNIAVTTVNNGKTFKYIAPANISPARKAYEEKKKQQLEEVGGKKYTFDDFQVYLCENSSEYIRYYLTTTATVIMPQEAEYTDEQIKGCLRSKIQGNTNLLNDIYSKLSSIKNEDNQIEGINTNNGYITELFEPEYIDSDLNEWTDYNVPITVNFEFKNADGSIKFNLNNYQL